MKKPLDKILPLALAALLIGAGTALVLLTRKDAGLADCKRSQPSDFPKITVLDATAKGWAEHEAEAATIWDAVEPETVLEAGYVEDIESPEGAAVGQVIMIEAAPFLVGADGKETYAITTLTGRGCVLRGARIQVSEMVPESERTLVLAHELGHAMFNLDHDPNEGALMYRESSKRSVELSKRARQLIREQRRGVP